MAPALKLQLLRYWLAANASAFDSAVAAVMAFFGLAGVHTLSDSVPALTLPQGGYVFLLAFARGLLAWLAAHPLSLLQPTATPTPEPKDNHENKPSFLKSLMIVLACGVLSLSLFRARAQTNQVPNLLTNQPTISAGLTEIYQAIAQSGLATATNYAVEPYLTYAPSLPTKFGGGVLAVYNVDRLIGLGLGADYCGTFTMISANATLKLPIHPLTFLHNDFGTNFAVVPFQLAGGGLPFSGANSGVVITDTGAYLSYGHLWGGQFNTGAAYGQWMNAGAYSGKRYHIFFGWSKGF